MSERNELKIAILFIAFAAWYLGCFTEQLNILYQCKLDNSFVIKGAFWKGEEKFECKTLINKEKI